jgi:DNA-binding PadR family transcriptional regulator
LDGGWAYGHHRPSPRRGCLGLAVLQVLSEKPMHGYVLAQELARTYQCPLSASLAYPTLQDLSDRKYLAGEEKMKKVQEILAEARRKVASVVLD